MYKQLEDPVSKTITAVIILETFTSIPFDPENTDYQKFKTNINDESSQLETVDGIVMSPEAAKAYVATLP